MSGHAKKLTTKPIQRRGKIDALKAYQLRVQHRMSYQQIADHLDCSKGSVIQRLKQFSETVHSPEDKAAFESIRAQAMTAVEEQLIASLLDTDKLAKASLNNVAYAFQQIHTARRLEEGKSTENKSIITAMLDSAHDKLYSTGKYVESPQVVDSNPAKIMDEPVTD